MAYTATVKKEKFKTCIRTSRENIEGMIFKLPQSRLLDMLNNKTEPFFAVCNATVSSIADGKLLYKTNFMAVNKNHVIHISGETLTDEEVMKDAPED
jgi:hypothetical protein